MSWINAVNARDTFAAYCAPTVTAALFGVSRLDAAQMLLDEGIAGGPVGSVRAFAWDAFLQSLGAVKMAKAEVCAAHPSFDPDASWYEWQAPTVAQFLRSFTGTGVVNVKGHTLLVQDGEVIADSMSTDSLRARVQSCWILTERAPGLEAADATVLAAARQYHKDRLALKRQRRERERKMTGTQRLEQGLNALFSF